MLQLRELKKRYGRKAALDGMSFAVGEGQMFGFVGANGAGKTTTMRIVLGVLASDGGEVLWHGEPVDGEVRRRFGYMPEERGSYPDMKVGEQPRFFAKIRGLLRREAQKHTASWPSRSSYCSGSRRDRGQWS